MERDKKFMTFDFMDQMDITGVPEPKMVQIHTIARDSEGRFYLSDEFNHRIVILDSDGKCVRTFGKRGSGHGEFWYPRGLAVLELAGSPQLVVCDAWNHRLQRFHLDGAFIGAFGSIGGGEDNFNEPVSVIPAKEGGVWVLDRSNHRVKLCSLAGKTISTMGRHLALEEEDRQNDPADVLLSPKETSSRAFGLNYPQAFARRSDGGFVIADTNNSRICVVSKNGEVVRLINLKGSAPPYFFPMSIAVLDNSVALVGGVNSSYQAIDLKHPWRVTEPPFVVDDSLAPCAALVNENAKFFLVDGHKGVISKYVASFSEQDFVEAPSQRLKIDSEEVSRDWANCVGGYWLEYLGEAPEREQTLGQRKSFYTTCRDEATKAANELNQHEGEYLKHLIGYYETKSLLDRAGAEGEPQQDLMPDFSWKLLTLRQGEKQRTELRKILIQNLGWMINLITKLDAEYRKDNFSAEESELIALIEEEHKLRKDDYEKVLLWLKESLQKVDALNISTALHACAGLLFLHDHIQYLRKSLALVGSDSGDEPERLPETLSIARKNVLVSLANRIFFILGDLCAEWSLYESAIAIYSHGKSLKTGEEGEYEVNLVTVYFKMGDPQRAIGHVKNITKSPSYDTYALISIGDQLSSNYYYKEALEVWGKALEKLSPAQPQYSTTMIGVASGLLQICRPADAMRTLDDIAKSASKDDLTLYGHAISTVRAIALIVLGKLDESASILERMVKDYPEEMATRLQLAVNLSLLGKASDAEEAIASEKEKFQDSETMLHEGVCMRIKGEYHNALGTMKLEGSLIYLMLMERVISAFGIDQKAISEEAINDFISYAEKSNLWHSYIFMQKAQAAMIEKALDQLASKLLEAGRTLEVNKQNAGAWHYEVKACD